MRFTNQNSMKFNHSFWIISCLIFFNFIYLAVYTTANCSKSKTERTFLPTWDRITWNNIVSQTISLFLETWLVQRDGKYVTWKIARVLFPHLHNINSEIINKKMIFNVNNVRIPTRSLSSHHKTWYKCLQESVFFCWFNLCYLCQKYSSKEHKK